MEYITYIVTFVVVVLIFFLLYKIFRFIISILLVGLLALIAYFTNPSLEKHREAVQAKARKENISMRNKKVDRESFYIFSMTRVKEGADFKVVGAGAFTKVIVFRNP
jgi:energy-coupling factor transporter transmembrane protein EcfT